jgi:hypothetical protein
METFTGSTQKKIVTDKQESSSNYKRKVETKAYLCKIFEIRIMNNIVAIVGRPNVGNQPFNRLIQRRSYSRFSFEQPETETMGKVSGTEKSFCD